MKFSIKDFFSKCDQIRSFLPIFLSSVVTSERLKKAPLLTQRKLYEFLTLTKTAKKEILVEQDVPDVIENVVALKYLFVSYILLNYQNRLHPIRLKCKTCNL